LEKIRALQRKNWRLRCGRLYDKNATSDDKGRLYCFDNVKFILIFLVVLAHTLSPRAGRND